MKSKLTVLVLLMTIIIAGAFVYQNHVATVASGGKPSVPEVNYCANNASGQKIIVSISKRHIWACSGAKQAHDSAVVTGMEMYPADLTPTGTYQIYDKLKNQDLTGSDSTGSWNDHVNYWIPFLQNQYGTYGFHDAAWRSNSDFGNIDPNSKEASHGCIELPLSTAKWLYGWVDVGTSVSITD